MANFIMPSECGDAKSEDNGLIAAESPDPGLLEALEAKRRRLDLNLHKLLDNRAM